MLSIIVPVYNVEKYLDECLSSIERQTSKNFEVIIVNDGSSDNCQSIIDKYCLNNKNFKCFLKENGGLMSAYLYGIDKSIGDYIGFVDSDDYIDEKFVELMYDNNVEKADIVICDRYDIIGGVIRSSDVAPLFSGFYNPNNNSEVYKKILPPFSGRHISNARWNKIFKREIVLDNLKYCESKSRIMEDRFFTPSCMFSAESFKFLEEKLYFYRHRKGSNHSMASPYLYDSIKLLIDVQRQMMKDKMVFDKYIKEYEMACLNYLSLFIDRNLLVVQERSKALLYSRQIIRDPFFKTLVKKNRKSLKNKKGLALKFAYTINSPAALALLCCLFVNK